MAPATPGNEMASGKTLVFGTVMTCMGTMPRSGKTWPADESALRVANAPRSFKGGLSNRVLAESKSEA